MSKAQEGAEIPSPLLHVVSVNSQDRIDGVPYPATRTQALVNGRKVHLHKLISPDVAEYLNNRPPFHVKLAPGAARLAVLTYFDGQLQVDIKEPSDEYSEATAFATIPPDDHFQWIKIEWSEEADVLAVALSSGDIHLFNVDGNLIHTIEADEFDLHAGVADMFFYSWPDTDVAAGCELFVLTYDCQVRRFWVPKTGALAVEESGSAHDVSMHHTFVTSMSICRQSRVVAIAGSVGSTDVTLSFWRFYNKDPYWDLLSPEIEQPGEPFKPQIPARRKGYIPPPPILKVESAPGRSRLMVTLDLNGNVSLWDSRSRTRCRQWTSEVIFNQTKGDLPADFRADDHRTSSELHHLSARSLNEEKTADIVDVKWWDETSVVFVRRNGTISVCGPVGVLIPESNLKSIFADATLRFNPRLDCTTTSNGRFFVLEQEITNEDVQSKNSEAEEDAEESDDSDNKEQRVSVTLRLSSVIKASPQELFERKIELAEYGAALKLAKLYNLNTDLLYKKRWCMEPVWSYSITEYLSKVQDLKWVLRACKERIPDKFDAAKDLLEFGIQQAVPRAVKDILQRSSSHDLKENVAHKVAEALKSTGLTEEDMELLYYRLLLLRYLDRLKTYGSIVEHEYNARDYLQFRSSNLINSAVLYAQQDNVKAVDAILTYHSEHTLKWRLTILSHFSETLPPDAYADLLPDVRDDDPTTEGEWDIKSWREKDWVESDEVLQLLGLSCTELEMYDIEPILRGFALHSAKAASLQFSDPEELYNLSDPLTQAAPETLYAPRFERPQPMDKTLELPPELPIPTYPASAEDLTKWYIWRSREIESRSGLVDNATAIIELGINNGIPGLNELYTSLLALHTLVYECNKDIRLSEFEKLQDYDKFCLLLEDATESNVVSLLKSRMQHFLQQEKSLWMSENIALGQSFLYRWMIDQVKMGRLFLAAAIIKHSRPSLGSERIITSDKLLLTIALDCVYSCRDVSSKTWADMTTIFESLPERDQQYKDLHDRVDKLERHLAACELLHKYGLAQPIETFLTTWNENNVSAVHNLITKVAQKGVKAQPPFSTAQWKSLLRDMLTLCESIFPFCGQEFCYKQFCLALLKASNFKLAQEYLHKVADAEQLILSVSNEFFNSCTTAGDEGMLHAMECLKLIKAGNADVRKEICLIEGIRKLYKLGLTNVLPVKIRLSSDRLEYIHQLLNTSPTAYQAISELLEIASLLGRGSPEDKNAVRLLVAETAYEQEDYMYSCHLCTELVTYQYAPCWKLCRRLGLCEHFKSLDIRMQLLSFAMMHAPPEDLPLLVTCWRTLEVRYQAQSVGIDQESIDQAVYSIPIMTTPMSPSTRKRLTPSKVRSSTNLTGSGALHQRITLSARNCEQFLHVCLQRLLELETSELVQAVSGKVEEGLPYTFTLPDYYLPLGQSRHDSIYSSAHQEPAGPNNDLIDQVKQQIFHVTTLTMSAGSSRRKVVKDLALRALHDRDLARFIATLFCFEKLNDAVVFLDEMITQNASRGSPDKADFIAQLAEYYISLEILANQERAPEKGADQLKSYAYPPTEVVKRVSSMMQQNKFANVPAELNDGLKVFQQKRADFVRTQELKELDVDIDTGKFSIDDKYKLEVILRMARAAKLVALTKALELSRKYGKASLFEAQSLLRLMAVNGVDVEILADLIAEEGSDEVNLAELFRSTLQQLLDVLSSMHELEGNPPQTDEEFVCTEFPPASPELVKYQIQKLTGVVARAASVSFETPEAVIEELKISTFDEIRNAIYNLHEAAAVFLLRLLLQHKTLYEFASSYKGDTTLYRSDLQRLERLSSTAIVSKFLGSQASDMQIETTEEKAEFFAKLLGKVETKQEFIELAELLRVWSRAEEELITASQQTEATLPLAECWCSLFDVLIQKGEFDLLFQIRETLALHRVYYVSIEGEETLLNRLVEQPPVIRYKFGLMSQHQAVRDLTAEQMREAFESAQRAERKKIPPHMFMFTLFFPRTEQRDITLTYGHDYDAKLLQCIVRLGILHVFSHAAQFYDLLIGLLLYINGLSENPCYAKQSSAATSEADDYKAVLAAIQHNSQCATYSIERAVASLAAAGRFMQAGLLALIHKQVPNQLHTVDVALQFLPNYLVDRLNYAERMKSSRSISTASDGDGFEWVECADIIKAALKQVSSLSQ